MQESQDGCYHGHFASYSHSKRTDMIHVKVRAMHHHLKRYLSPYTDPSLITCTKPHQHYRSLFPSLSLNIPLGEQHSDSTAQIVCHFAIVCTVDPFNILVFCVLLLVVKILSTLTCNLISVHHLCYIC